MQLIRHRSFQLRKPRAPIQNNSFHLGNMSTPLGQLGGATATKAADVELIESQLMGNQAATLPGDAMVAPQAPRIDAGALPSALPPVAFPTPMPSGMYTQPMYPPPAVSSPNRGALDEYAFPVCLFIITVIVLSPYVETILKRVLPASAQNVWVAIAIRAALVTAGFMVLDKLNQ